jgi:hypothetical protein
MAKEAEQVTSVTNKYKYGQEMKEIKKKLHPSTKKLIN